MIKLSLFAASVMCVFLLWAYLVPHLTSSQDQILGGDEQVIFIERKQYVIPREFHSTGEGNPVNFWSWGIDPTFIHTEISAFHFIDMDGQKRLADIQAFVMNPHFSSVNAMEKVLAVRSGSEVYEYQVPNLLISTIPGMQVHFVGQINGKLVYYYHDYSSPHGRSSSIKTFPALFLIDLPFKSGIIEIVSISNKKRWSEVLEDLKKAGPSKQIFLLLCSERTITTQEFAKEYYGESCS